MTDRIRVLIADDHTLFRKGVVELINEHARFELVGEAGDGLEAVDLARRCDPDVILMDVHMPRQGGVDAVREIKDQHLGRVLMLTVSDKNSDLLAAIEAGADGYLLKNTEPQALYDALQEVAAGHSVLSPEVTRAVMNQAGRSPAASQKSLLTPREAEVLRQLAKGSTTAQIALALGIQPSTVKTHIHNLLGKLEAANRAEAVAKALNLGLLG